MYAFLSKLFDADFMSHGSCYFWQPEIVWLHVVSDALITISYYAIPFGLIYFVHKRKDLPFSWIFLLFGAFIIACGTTHLLEIWSVWFGTYRLTGIVKLATALISVGTAITLVPLIPKALTLPSPTAFQELNETLEQQVEERTRELEEARRELEIKVRDLEQAQGFLQKRELELGLFIDHTPAAIAIFDLDMRFLRCSGRWLEDYRQQDNVLIGKTYYEVFPEDADRWQAVHARCLRGEVEKCDGEPITQQDGTVEWLKWEMHPWRNATGEIGGLIMSTEFITSQKELEQALRDSEMRYQDLYENAPDMYVSVDSETSHIVQCNQTLSTTTGYAKEEMIGHPVLDMYHPDCHDQAHAAFQMFVADGVVNDKELQLQCKDGRKLDVSLNVRAIRDENGNIVASRSSWRDITDRKQAERMVQAERRRFQRTFEQAAVGIAHVGPDGRWMRVNNRLCDIVGYTREELLEKTFQDITHPDDLDKDLKQVHRMLAGEITNYTMEKRYLKKSGEVVWINLTVSLVRNDDNEPDYFISVVEDIETRKRMEEQIQQVNLDLEKRVEERTAALHTANEQLQTYTRELKQRNQELEEFAYVASHDLQEPLRKIQAFGDRLSDRFEDVLPEQGQDYLSRMKQAARRMQTLIADLLTLSRVTTRAKPFEPVDIATVVKGVLSDLEARIEDTNGQVEVEPLPKIEADQGQMRQLFQNLIANALKFHQQDVAPHVKISSHIPDDTVNGNDRWWTFTVEDNGIGFDEKYKDRIFQSFERLHGRNNYEGTGMGLAICRKIVERHSGSIIAEGKLGEGSKFTIKLPVTHNGGAVHE